MHVENHRSLNSKNSLITLFSYLLDHFSTEEVLSFFDISKHECSKILKSGNINMDLLFRILEKCHLSHANLLERKIDFDCVGSILKNKRTNPLRYTLSNYSSLRISDNILSHCPLYVRKDALNYLQTDSLHYSPENMNSQVSTILNSDLLYYLSKYHHFSPKDFYLLGNASGHYNKNLPFGKSFVGLNLKNSFLKVIEEIAKHFETSFSYELVSLNNDKAIIRKNLSKKMKDELKTNIYSNEHLCHYVQGSFSAIAFYSTGTFSNTTEEKCLYRGDSTCEFHVHFNDLRPFSFPKENLAPFLH